MSRATVEAGLASADPDPIERRIIEKLDELVERWRTAGRPDDPRRWTADVKMALCEIGRPTYKVCASGIPAEARDFGEWLYDVTWLHYDEGNYLIDCPLVCETENEEKDDAIWDDWQKLMIANAGHRIMLFGKTTDAARDQVLDRMTREAEQYKKARPGDRFLLAGWSDGQGESDQADNMKYRIYVIGISS